MSMFDETIRQLTPLPPMRDLDTRCLRPRYVRDGSWAKKPTAVQSEHQRDIAKIQLTLHDHSLNIASPVERQAFSHKSPAARRRCRGRPKGYGKKRAETRAAPCLPPGIITKQVAIEKYGDIADIKTTAELSSCIGHAIRGGKTDYKRMLRLALVRIGHAYYLREQEFAEWAEWRRAVKTASGVTLVSALKATPSLRLTQRGLSGRIIKERLGIARSSGLLDALCGRDARGRVLVRLERFQEWASNYTRTRKSVRRRYILPDGVITQTEAIRMFNMPSASFRSNLRRASISQSGDLYESIVYIGDRIFLNAAKIALWVERHNSEQTRIAARIRGAISVAEACRRHPELGICAKTLRDSILADTRNPRSGLAETVLFRVRRRRQIWIDPARFDAWVLSRGRA